MMKQGGLIILSMLQICFFSSCLTTKQTNLLRKPGGGIPSYIQVEAIGEYTIKPGDELNIIITTMPDEESTESIFSPFTSRIASNQYSRDNKLQTFSVSPNGSIYFPYIGDIQVAGKTTLEIQGMLKEKIDSNIVEFTQVNVYLANRFFSVIGESRAGRYPIAKEQTTIFQALSMSGDVLPWGDRSKVKIIRQTADGSMIKTFDLRSADIVNSEFYYIQPNDVIYIQPMGRQFLGISSFGAFFALIAIISSVGFTIYNIVK